MSHHPPSENARIIAAQRVLEVAAQRAAVDEAVGVLRCWWACSTTQARTELHARYDQQPGEQAGGDPGLSVGLRVEAARVVAVANAAADRFADPDFDS